MLGGFLRRILLAFDRGDLAKLPFSDDVNAQSRLLMRRNVRDRVAALAPFLTFDQDPYIVVGDDGRLSWIMDAFTSSDSYPYSTHHALEQRVHQLHAQQRQGGDRRLRWHHDLLCLRQRGPDPGCLSRHLPVASSRMPRRCRPGCASTCATPSCCSSLQAEVYGLYHMTNPEVFYNREDLWTVATETGMGEGGEQTTQPMQPNFVLMKLPGEDRRWSSSRFFPSRPPTATT